MSVINPNETQRNWRTSKVEPSIQLYVSAVDGVSPELMTSRVSGFPVELNTVPVTDWINPEGLRGATAAVIQVDVESPASLKRFDKLAHIVETPLIAAAYNPPLALVRSLLRTGAQDVIPLPVTVEELEAALVPLRGKMAKLAEAIPVSTGKLVSVVKSVGGVGATALLSQLAIRFARREGTCGRQACMLDLDLQFGDVAFQLGLNPKFSLLELLEAGPRLDADLMRATMIEHSSGLKVIAAPDDLMPIEGMPTDQLMRVIELARREFDCVFIDLPTNWTNWSLSVLAQSNLVLLVTEQTVAGINRAKRQLMLFESQDLGELDVRVIINRFEKGLTKTIRPADIRAALGRDAGYNIANDFQLMRTAIDRGIPIDELKRKSALGKDLDALDAGVAAALGLER